MELSTKKKVIAHLSKQEIGLEEAIDRILELQDIIEFAKIEIEGLKQKYYYDIGDNRCRIGGTPLPKKADMIKNSRFL